MLVRAILPRWASEEFPDRKKVIEGDFTDAQLHDLNEQLYNIHNLPNYPSSPPEHGPVDGTHIDTFKYVFVDFDLKSGTYTSKEAFVETLLQYPLMPSRVIDSGNGVHSYWEVSDLDAMTYLRLQRRLMRHFKTDEAVAKIFQLMRPPGFVNTKHKDGFVEVKELLSTGAVYTAEDLHKALPLITKEDEEYCKRHYDQTYNIEAPISIDDKIPLKFKQLIKTSSEVRDIWRLPQEDRSSSDYRLAHIMFAEGFTKEEALSVLVNCQKALTRSPHHRVNYATNIVDKIWVYENTENKDEVQLSNSVKDILSRGKAIRGTKLPCWEIYDGFDHGFRLTEVLGLIGGAGSGKTTLALNYFYWFAKRNPDYIHVFVSLEQPEEEIALRWAKMTGANEALHEKVHVLGNYNPDGSYRNLSLGEVEDYILELEKKLKTKVGCVVVDHIGVLKKRSKEGESQGLIDICHEMKAFAKRTNTFLVMQSQTSREKAGIGDLELDKDGAYGTSMFEWYCDFLVTTWQPLKRVYSQATHMTCSAFKYCKIRHKNVKLDKIKEDAVYVLMFDPDNESLSQMTEAQEIAYEHFNKIATTLRNKDRKREPTRMTSITWAGKETEDGEVDNNHK